MKHRKGGHFMSMLCGCLNFGITIDFGFKKTTKIKELLALVISKTLKKIGLHERTHKKTNGFISNFNYF